MKIKTTEQSLEDLRDNLTNYTHRIGKIYAIFQQSEHKLINATPKEKDDFLKFFDRKINEIENWSIGLRQFRDNITIEVLGNE